MAALAGEAAVPAVYTISLFSGKVAGSWARAATVGTGMPRVMSFMSTVMPFFSKAASRSLSTGVGDGRGVDGGHLGLAAVGDRAHVALHQLRRALEDGLLVGVSRAGPVEFVELLEQVQGDAHLAPPGHVGGGGKAPAHQVQDARGGLVVQAFVPGGSCGLGDGHDLAGATGPGPRSTWRGPWSP